MKTKKTVIAVLIVAVLISTVLIIGCIEPLDKISASQSAGEDDNFVIPAGKGVVRFKIANGDARTIMPDNSASGLQVTAMYFDIMFDDGSTTSYYPVGSAGNPPATKLIYASINEEPVALDPGSYHVVITAYDDASGTIPIAGWTSPSNITITSGVNASSETVNLIGFVDGTKNGTFEYNITIPDDIDYVPTLYIKGSGNAAAAAVNRSIVLAEDNEYTDVPETLPSGYYFVDLLLEKSHYRTEGFHYVLHIYPAMTSKMPALVVTTTDLIENEFPVTFVTTGETLSTPFVSPVYFGYANFISVDPPVPDDTSVSFGGWYEDSSFNTALSATKRVLDGTITLYAKYVAAGTKGSNPLEITFEIDDPAGAATVSSLTANPTIIVADFISGAFTSITIRLSGSWAKVEWGVDDISDTVVAHHVVSNELVINNSQDFARVLVGDFNVYVRAAYETYPGTPVAPNPPDNGVTIHVTPLP